MPFNLDEFFQNKPFSLDSFFKKKEDEEPELPEGKVDTSASFRKLDVEKAKNPFGFIEGGLRAARNEPVPAELAVSAGEQGRLVDRREATDLKPDVPEGQHTPLTRSVEEKADVVGEGLARFTEGMRRGIDSLEERRGRFFGVGPELREMAPQRATEDTRVVAPADTFTLSAIDFAGEVAPEAVASIAVGGVTGANKVVAEALSRGTGSAVRNWAANRAAHVGLGVTENFFSASVPLEDAPEVGVGILAFSTALSAFGPVGNRIANRVMDDDVINAPLARNLAEMFQETEEAARLKSHALSPDSFPSNVKLPTATGTLAEAFQGSRKAAFDLKSAQATALEDLSKLADAKLVPFEVLSNGRIRVDGTEVATLKEAANLLDSPNKRFSMNLSRSIQNFLGADTDEIIERTLAKFDAEDKGKQLRSMLALAESNEHRARMMQLADELDDTARFASDSEVTELHGALPGGELLAFPAKIRQAAQAANERAKQIGENINEVAAAKTEGLRSMSPLFKEIYINGALTNLSTQMINVVSNFLQLALRTGVVGTEGGIGTTARSLKAVGFGDAGEEVTSKGVSQISDLLQGYVRGSKTFLDVASEVGADLRAKDNPTLSNFNHILEADNMSRGEYFFNLARTFTSLFQDGGNKVAKNLNETLSNMSGRRVDVGSIASDAALGRSGLDAQVGVGKARKAVRTPTSFLQVMDTFFKSVNFEGERAVLLKRKAAINGESVAAFMSSKGRQGAELEGWNRIQQELVDEAAHMAQVNTFTNRLGEFGTALKTLRDSATIPLSKNGFDIGGVNYRPAIPVGIIFQPFMQTPINIAKNFALHSPLGFAKAPLSYLGGAGGDQVTRELAQGAVGSMVMLGTLYGIDQGWLKLTATPPPGAEGRTAQLAAGGQYIDASFVKEDGTLIPLNRFGPPGLLLAAAIDITRKYTAQVEAELERAELQFEKGVIDENRLAEIRANATDVSILEILGSLEPGEAAGLAGRAGASALANNVWNETSIADAVNLLVELGRVSQNPDRADSILDELLNKTAGAIQPVSALNSLAKAEQQGRLQVPSKEASLGSNIATRFAQRVPFLEPEHLGVSPQDKRPLIDVAGAERTSRFPGDQSESLLTRFAGTQLGPFASLVGLNTPAIVNDETKARGIRVGQEMVDLGIDKDFPDAPNQTQIVTEMPDNVRAQFQAFKGQMRVALAEKIIEHPNYQAIKQQNPRLAAEHLSQAISRADNLANEFGRNVLFKQKREGQELDLTAFPSWPKIQQEFNLDVAPIIFFREEEESPFFSR